MLETVLVAPGVARDAAALKIAPHLALVAGQLMIVEPAANEAAVLHQPVALIVPVAALGLALVQAADELYLLPLGGLRLEVRGM